MQAAAEPPVVRAAAPSGARITHDVADVAALHHVHETCARAMLRASEIAHLHVGTRVLVLHGDTFPPVDGEPDGRATLARAWKGRLHLRLAEIAPVLGVSIATLSRICARREMPAMFDGVRWVIERDVLVRWLLRCRVPARREVAA